MWSAIAVFLAIAGLLLLREPCLGVADNLDFWRVMRPAGIEHLEPVKGPGQFVHCTFVTSRSKLWTGLSSPALMAWAAKHLFGGLAESPNRMDLRQVGLLYLLVVAALLTVGVHWGAPPFLTAGWLYVLLDPGYLLFLNSFYADPALLVAVLGIGLWFVQPDPFGEGESSTWWRRGGSLCLVALVILGGASKMQYVLLPAVGLLALVSLAFRRSRQLDSPVERAASTHRVLRLLAVLLLVAVAVPWHYFRGPAPRFLEVNNYHAVYGGLLRVTGQPDLALRFLGIPSEYRDLPRRDVWAAELPLDHPVLEHLEGLSRLRLLKLYLSEPAAIVAASDRIDETLATVETHRRGSFPRGMGRGRWTQYGVPWQFSHLRGVLFGPWPDVVWLLFGAAAVWLATAALRGRWRGREAGLLFLFLFAASQLVVVILGDGFVALEQHLLGARFALDLLLVLLLHELAATAVRHVRRRGVALSALVVLMVGGAVAAHAQEPLVPSPAPDRPEAVTLGEA